MKREDISDMIGNISARYIEEAQVYTTTYKVRFFKKPLVRMVIAAVLALCVFAGGIGVFSSFGGMTVAAFAYGTNEEITAAGAIIDTGSISDSGEMEGSPLRFYLSGNEIETVRFSCKNQQIDFIDWTEKRDEFGLSQNFTVAYGKDVSEYYYLVINWEPNKTIRALTDDKNMTIASLPADLRDDVIVMEITFVNGKTATKAITVSLQNNGKFLAAFNDYKITKQDSFVKRPDSKAIPRDILNAPDAPIIKNDYQKDDSSTPATNGTGNSEILVKTKDQAAAAAAARAYYTNTVLKVVKIELIEQTEATASFSVQVSKGGLIQDPNRTIILQLRNGVWTVTNEGY
jgi:hypothetical protein